VREIESFTEEEQLTEWGARTLKRENNFHRQLSPLDPARPLHLMKELAGTA
jgi:hypothetical protein